MYYNNEYFICYICDTINFNRMEKQTRPDPNNYIVHNIYKANISQKAVCAAINVSKATLLRYINDSPVHMTIEQSIKLAGLFGIPYDRFIYCLIRNKPNIDIDDKWYIDNVINKP